MPFPRNPRVPFEPHDARVAALQAGGGGEELAQAVAAGDTAMLIAPDNTRRCWTTLSDALVSGSSFAVRIRPDVLAVDFDRPACPDPAAAAEELAGLIAAVGVRPVIIASGRPGHRHLFAHVGEELFTHLAGLASGLGGNVRSGSSLCRPPLAPHRQGLPAALVSPATITEAVDALYAAPPRRQQPPRSRCSRVTRVPANPEGADRVLPGLPNRRRDLTPRMASVLAAGDPERYRSGSEEIFAIATAAAWAAWSREEVSEALADPVNVGGRAHRAKPHRFEAVWDKAVTTVAAKVARNAGWELDDYRSWLASRASCRWGEPYRRRHGHNPRGARSWLRRCWQAAAERPANTPPDNTVDGPLGEASSSWLDTAATAIRAAGGRATPARSKLAAAIARLADRRGTLDGLPVSERALEAMTAMDRKTIRKHLHWMTEAGLLQLVRKGRGRLVRTSDGFDDRLDASTWRLLQSVPAPTSPTGGTPPPRGPSPEGHPHCT